MKHITITLLVSLALLAGDTVDNRALADPPYQILEGTATSVYNGCTLELFGGKNGNAGGWRMCCGGSSGAYESDPGVCTSCYGAYCSDPNRGGWIDPKA
jgi:hypothetical protein